jgi:hypothetical protein
MVQFDTELRMTPFGAAVKMLTMHKKHEVPAESSAMDENGAGLGALATMDDTGLVIELWNLQPKSGNVDVSVLVTNIPAGLRSSSFRIRRYQIDSQHSNCFSGADSAGGLELVEEMTQPASEELRFEVEMEPMALCLWQIEVAEGE